MAVFGSIVAELSDVVISGATVTEPDGAILGFRELEKKIPYYRERLTVKPGITGYAQVLYPYGASEKDALE